MASFREQFNQFVVVRPAGERETLVIHRETRKLSVDITKTTVGTFFSHLTVTLTSESDLRKVKVNQHVKYLGRRSSRSHRHTCMPIALPGPPKCSVKADVSI